MKKSSERESGDFFHALRLGEGEDEFYFVTRNNALSLPGIKSGRQTAVPTVRSDELCSPRLCPGGPQGKRPVLFSLSIRTPDVRRGFFRKTS